MKLSILDAVVRDVKAVAESFREDGARSTFAWIGSLDSPVSFQFVKYAVFGGASTIVHLGLFAWFSHSIFPAHDYLVEGGMPDGIKEHRAIMSNLAAFPGAALFNYLLSVRFVFTSGRHSRRREFLLFVGISFLSFAAGLLCGPTLISRGLNPWFAQFGLVAGSALANFLFRKYLIFLR